METDRPDAIFRDPYARRLAGERGEAIVDHLKRGRAMAWPMIVRTAVFDELILACVRERGADMVINLAAGLDARPWRMPLPRELRWVDVDLPEILQYKTDMLRDDALVCRYEAVFTDLTDADARRSLFERLGAESKRTLILTEGLLVYLTPEQVSALATDLHAQREFQWWVIDLASPLLRKFIERSWGSALEKGNAPMRFFPVEGTDFFRPLGWREVAFRSTGEESRRLHREMKGAWLWRILGLMMSKERRAAYQRMSGQVLLERVEVEKVISDRLSVVSAYSARCGPSP